MTAETVTLNVRTARTATLKLREARTVTGDMPEITSESSVILVMLDDIGQDVLGIYDATEGGQNQWAAGYDYPDTTNFDVIAAEGVTYDNAYASPICSPTRAQILTGRYPHIHADHDGTGVGTIMGTLNEWSLAGDTYPIPKVLAAVKTFFRTAAIGKWHLNDDQTDYRHPVDTIGFNQYQGLTSNPNVDNDNPAGAETGGTYFDYWKTDIDDDAADSHAYETSADFLSTDEYEDAALFVAARTSPFFLQWWAHSCHFWMDPIPDDAGPGGIQLTTTLNHSEQLPASDDDDEGGLLDPNGPGNVPWRRQMSHVEAIDKLVGMLRLQVPAALRSNVIWIVLGDNGTAGTMFTSRDDTFFGNVKEPPVGIYDKGHSKSSGYEQGVRVPLIIGGPGFPAEGKGTRNAGLVDVTDLYPTILDILAYGWDKYLEGEGVLDQVDGISLMDTFYGNAATRQFTMSTSYGPVGATVGQEEDYVRAVTSSSRWKVHFNKRVNVYQTDKIFFLGPIAGGNDHGYSADILEKTDRHARIIPGDAFDANVWAEYNEIAQWLLSQLLSEADQEEIPDTVFSMAPPFTAALISPTLAPEGTKVWDLTFDSDHLGESVAIGNAGAYVYDQTADGLTVGKYHLRCFDTSDSDPPTALFDVSWQLTGSGTAHWVEAARVGDAAVSFQKETIGAFDRITLRAFTSASTAANWEWTSPPISPTPDYGVKALDDGTGFVVWYALPATASIQLVTFGIGSGVPTSNVAAPLSAGAFNVTVSGNGAVAAGWSSYRRPFVWNAATGAVVYQVGFTFGSSDMSISSDGTVLAQGAFGTLNCWEDSGGWAHSFDTVIATSSYSIQKVLVSPDGSTIFFQGQNNTTGTLFFEIGAVDVATQTLLFQRTIPFKVAPDLTTIKLSCSDDGEELVVLLEGNDDDEYTTILYRYKTGAWQSTINLYELGGEPIDGDLASDGSTYAVAFPRLWSSGPGTSDGELTLIDLPT